ncbi:MAG: SDR family oxidoreductase [Candidatus Nanopelagicales bacterium]|jgi:3-oxoacyl-[acyl-carrier protein] reductase|nr:SDR family oxidoreductase [Candidatus Nanopelagicales bacterium]
MDLGLHGRTFLLTGASRGLGLAAAQALVAEGAQVVLSARDPQALTDAVTGLGSGAVGLAADLADPAAAERLVAGTVARFGRLDGALVSVGGPAPGTPMSVTDEQWRAGFESVLLGAVRMIRSVAAAASVDPETPAGTGAAILAVLSTSAKSPIPGLTTSNGLRPGLAMLVKDFADELGPRGVRVNGVLPGRIATDRTLALDASHGNAAAARRRNEAAIPLGRYGDPAEFGRLAAFLLSPAASYVNGSLIPIDGGALRAL